MRHPKRYDSGVPVGDDGAREMQRVIDAARREETETFFWDKVTGEPCPRSGNVLCTLPWTDEHRHVNRAPSPSDAAPSTTEPGDER